MSDTYACGHNVVKDIVAKGFRARKGEVTQSENERLIGDKATFRTFQGVKK